MTIRDAIAQDDLQKSTSIVYLQIISTSVPMNIAQVFLLLKSLFQRRTLLTYMSLL